MKRVLALFLAIGSLALVLALGGSGRAAVVALDVADLTAGADLCVRAQVVAAQSAWTADQTMIHTTYTLEVLETLKGAPQGMLEVSVPGGDLDGIRIRNGEAPEYRVGEQVVAFLKTDPEGDRLMTFGWFQGKFTLLDGKVRELADGSWTDLRNDILASVR